MENPAQDIKQVVQTLAQGTPDAQRDAIYRYFAPGAAFEHPFCRVPSFKNLHIPGVGSFDSRLLIAAIYRWYKILSPKIELEIESCVHDERANLLYLTIFQVFSIWFIPFHRAPVRLVSEKRQAVQEGAEPSYAAVTAGDAPASDAASSSAAGPPTRYVIDRQQDLYQVNEFLRFVALQPGSAAAGFLQLVATLMCLLGATLLSPLINTVWPRAKTGKEEEEKGNEEKKKNH
ncbi:uncharacterized protein P884DRAFT_247213 [Thermothelomyces heterothallicus CBS 202.75]|uniref:uncharacterized protein n=1 Tax=Thermothelomyces heterothallicus CBS 202.75 TaxID=1149848 RepID=UPI00374455A6